jgi:DNA polymerase-1
MIGPGDHVVLIDGSSFIHRAYHAYPKLTRRRDGYPTGALSGFASMIWRIMKKHTRHYHFDSEVTHAAVIMDAPARNWRHDLYPEYKDNRKPKPDDLRMQIRDIPVVCEAFSLPCVEELGYEADDLIATYATIAADEGAKVTIVTSDKDLMQLVSEQIRIYDTMAEGDKVDNYGFKVKGKHIGRREVIDKFGVPPEQVADVLALMGDVVDNVPGVPSIGEKTAAKLVNRFGSVEEVIARAEEIDTPKWRLSIQENADAARLSRLLVGLDCTIPAFTTLDELTIQEMDLDRLHDYLRSMEMAELAGKVMRSINFRDRQPA